MARSDTRRSTQTQVFGVEPTPPPEEICRGEVGAETGSPMPAAAWPLPTARADGLPVEGDLVGGLYRLVRLIGEGMFGRVYVAERTDVPEHKVALKVIRRAVYEQRNVDRELVMLAAASHPHIVQLKDHGTTADYVWLTMPLLQGETLGARLERGPLTLREAYDVFLPIARGVEALHAAGLRHQDIKPDNIFLARFAGRIHPFLLDLGVAAEQSASFVAGTVMFAAPEQVMALGGMREGITLSAKIDTYCLASTLLRSLVGPTHFPGETAETPFELASAFVERETKPLRDEALPELTAEPRAKLAKALSRWLAYLPDARPSSGGLAEELDVLLEQEREIDALIERAAVRQKTSLQRIRIAAGGMLIVVLAAGGLAYANRETLRLAAELERARAGEAESFDRLDTCVVAHRLSQRQVQRCESDWQHDKDEFKATLDELSETENKAQTVLATRLANFSVKLRDCEDDARKAADEWLAEKDELERGWQTEQSRWQNEKIDWQTERSNLLRERDERSTELKSCQRTVNEAGSSRDECREDLADCIEARDTCLAAPPRSPPEPAGPAAPVASRPAEPKPSTPSVSAPSPTGAPPAAAAPGAPARATVMPPAPSPSAAPSSH